MIPWSWHLRCLIFRVHKCNISNKLFKKKLKNIYFEHQNKKGIILDGECKYKITVDRTVRWSIFPTCFAHRSGFFKGKLSSEWYKPRKYKTNISASRYRKRRRKCATININLILCMRHTHPRKCSPLPLPAMASPGSCTPKAATHAQTIKSCQVVTGGTRWPII